MNYPKPHWQEILYVFIPFAKKTLIAFLFMELFLYAGYWFAMESNHRSEVYKAVESPIAIKKVEAEEIPKVLGITSIKSKIEEIALDYGVSKHIMESIIDCESQYIPNVRSKAIKKDGKQENSWGLSQINLDAHTWVTKEQANDPEFAITFLAKNLKEGKGNMWTCYKTLKKKGVI